MSRVAILDSIGDDRPHPKYKEILSHVTFDGYTPPALRGRPLHGHGGWCAWDWTSQSLNPSSVGLGRIFDENGSGNLNVWPDIFAWLRDNGPWDYVSNSWGSNAPFNEAWLATFIAAVGDATIVFAASNSGRGTYAYPQRQLMDNQQVIIVGAIDSKGVRPEWSSTGQPGEQYVDVAYLGAGMSLDYRTGEVVSWAGTSKADPNCGGDLDAKGVTWREADKYFRDTAVRDDNYNGKPDGVEADYEAVILSGGFHPDVGRGCCESGRQENMRKTGLGLGVAMSGFSVRVEPAIQYLDFERLP